MGLLDKFLDAIKLNDDYDDEYDEEESYIDDDLDEGYDEDYEDAKPKKRFFSKFKSAKAADPDDEDTYEDDDETGYEAEEKARPAKPASRPAEPKAAPAREEKPRRERTARKNKNRRNAPSMEVNVIRPSSMEDTREIADTLLDSCTVVLNLEGLDVEIAQRVIDFTCGVCYALDGSLQKISNYIFIITPAEVDISGDYQRILSGAFDLPSMTSPY